MRTIFSHQVFSSLFLTLTLIACSKTALRGAGASVANAIGGANVVSTSKAGDTTNSNTGTNNSETNGQENETTSAEGNPSNLQDTTTPVSADQLPHSFYRFVFDSITVMDGCSVPTQGGWFDFARAAISELELKWDGKWQQNVDLGGNVSIGGLRAAVWASSTGVQGMEGDLDGDGDEQEDMYFDVSAHKAFDGSIGDNQFQVYYSENYTFGGPQNDAIAGPGSQFLAIHFGAQKVKLDGYRITGSPFGLGGVPDHYYMQYSDDGFTWITIPYSESRLAATISREVLFEAPVISNGDPIAYRYLRLVIDSVSGAAVSSNCTYDSMIGTTICANPNVYDTHGVGMVLGEVDLKWNGSWQANQMTSSNGGTIGGFEASITDNSPVASSPLEPWKLSTLQSAPQESFSWRAFDGLAFAGTDLGPMYGVFWGAASSFGFPLNPALFSTQAPFNASKNPAPYVQIDFGDNPVALEGFRITSGGACPAPDKFHFEGSNNGVNWKVLPGSAQEVVTSRGPAEVILK